MLVSDILCATECGTLKKIYWYMNVKVGMLSDLTVLDYKLLAID